MFIILYRNIFFTLTGILVLVSLVVPFVFGLNIGTDFTGGALVEVRYDAGRPAPESLQSALTGAGLESVSVRGAGDDSYIIRAAPLSAEAREALPQALAGGTIEKLTDIGPTVGKELRTKALLALSLVLLGIVLYVAFVFRKVSKPISSWVYGLITVVTLLHDVVIPVGAFALFGYLWGAQVDILFVTALLTILGFSVHDTIVVFDRVRENLRENQEKNHKEPFENVVGRSIDQTFVRSINTSLSTLIALLALFFLGPESTQDFALTLLIGIVAGAYSSIAVATPLLVAVAKWQGKA
jgi:preprotein translocase subunit SecF